MTDLEKEIRLAKPEYERMPSAFKARLRNQLQAQAKPSRLRHIGWIGSLAGVAALLVVGLFAWLVYTRPPLETIAAETPTTIVETSTVETAEPVEAPLLSEAQAITVAQQYARDNFIRVAGMDEISAERHPHSDIDNILFDTYHPTHSSDLAWLVRYQVQVSSFQTIYYAQIIDAESAETLAFYEQEYPFEPQHRQLVREKRLMEHARSFAKVDFKPVAAGALRVEYATSIVQLSYMQSIDLLGESAVSTYDGSNIIDMQPVQPDAVVWFAQIVGEFGEDYRRPHYYAVIMQEDGSVIAAGSSIKPIIDQRRTVRGKVLEDTKIWLTTVEGSVIPDEYNEFAFDINGAGRMDVRMNNFIVTIPEGAGTLDLGFLPYNTTTERLILVNNMREVGVHSARQSVHDLHANVWLVQTPSEIMAFSTTSPLSDDPDCHIQWQIGYFRDACSEMRWNALGVALENPSQDDMTRYQLISGDRTKTIVFTEPINLLESAQVSGTAHDGITLTLRQLEEDFRPTVEMAIIIDPVWTEGGTMQVKPFIPAESFMLWDQALTDLDSFLIDKRFQYEPNGSADNFQTITLPQTAHTYFTGQQIYQDYAILGMTEWDEKRLTAQVAIRLEDVRQTTRLELNFAERQAGDKWETDILLPLGLAAVRVTQVEWVDSAEPNTKTIRLYLEDGSPDSISLDCVGVVPNAQTESVCNPLGAWTLTQQVPDGETIEITIHGNVQFGRPWQVSWEMPDGTK